MIMELVKGYALMIAVSAALYGVKPGKTSTSKTLSLYGGSGGGI